MLNEFLKHPKALVFSVLVHAVLLGFIIMEVVGEQKKIAPQAQNEVTTIKAKAIDARDLEKQKKAKQEEVNKKKLAVQKKKLDTAKQAVAKRNAVKKKAEAAKKKKQDKKKAAKKKAEQKRAKEKKIEQERLNEVAKKRRKEEVDKAAKLKRQKEVAEKTKLKKIAAEKLEAERIKKETELKRIAKEKKKLADKRRAAEEEQKRKELELQTQIAAEERQNQLDDLKNQYLSAIQQKIQRNWRQPVNAGKMPKCEVNVLQGPGGVILDVTFGRCLGSTNYRLSVENAVYKSEPLPEPKDASLFDREVKILFKPNNK